MHSRRSSPMLPLIRNQVEAATITYSCIIGVVWASARNDGLWYDCLLPALRRIFWRLGIGRGSSFLVDTTFVVKAGAGARNQHANEAAGAPQCRCRIVSTSMPQGTVLLSILTIRSHGWTLTSLPHLHGVPVDPVNRSAMLDAGKSQSVQELERGEQSPA